jgi:glycosyltransferase involved in cell wall biosynthesis
MACGAWLLSKVMDIPLVLEVHHVDGYPRAANVKEHIFRVISILFFRIAGRSAIAFRAVNNEVALALSRCGIPQSKIKLIYSMYIDHAVFYPMPNIQKKYDLIFVGRLASNKGLGRLLAVFKTILRKLPSTSFFILGDGPQAAWLSRAIMGNTSIIHMKRVGSAYDVALLYNRSRVAVCASFAEGGPRYIVEALACGVPAVSVSVGLMRELIIDGKNGFLISPWSADAMAEKIISILEGDVGVYGAYRDNAVRSVARFDYADSIAAYAHAYHALITV